MTRFLVLAMVSLAICNPVLAQTLRPAGIPPDPEILSILKQRVDEYRWTVGMVVGIIEPDGRRRVIAYGRPAKDSGRPLTGDTIFEIGSITKVFTSLLLADAVERGEVALTDPISNFLPGDLKTPELNGRSITLVDLATHTSGLPQVFGNPNTEDADNPYIGYSVDQLYQLLSTFQLRRDIGSRFEYSNLGSGLLGHVLSQRSGTNYEALLQQRVTGPLGLRDTQITVSAEMSTRLAVGHTAGLRPIAPWVMPTLSAAGALRSTVNDLLTFLAAELGHSESTLATAMASMLKIQRPVGDPRRTRIGLGWLVYTRNGNEIVGHAGNTSGFQSAIAFDPKARAGVVVLANSSSYHQVADITLHLLDAGYSLDRPEPVERPIDPKLFDRYIGKYELQGDPRLMLAFSREENRFFVQADGQGKLELFAENENDFFLKVTDAQVTFNIDGDGQASSLILHQEGFDEAGRRVE